MWHFVVAICQAITACSHTTHDGSFSSTALLPTMVKQLMSGAVTRYASTHPLLVSLNQFIHRRSNNSQYGLMSYKDFVWFLLSEEDKTTPRRYCFLWEGNHLDSQDTCPICISVHTFRPLKSGHLTNKDTYMLT